VNDFIFPEDYSLQYISIDSVVHRIKKYGYGTELAKVDIMDAYKNIVVQKSDWDLLGSTWEYVNSDGEVKKEYYLDLVLPFGCRSSAKLFDNFATALELIMIHRGVTDVDHYLDDYITAGPGGSGVCQHNLSLMLQTFEDTDFPVNPDKTVLPTPIIEFLGIILDTIKMELRVSEERVTNIVAELCQWIGRRSCTKRQLLSIIGKLIFISKVIRAGRTFVRRMIELSKRVKYLHYRVKLNEEFREDVRWWLCYLKSWNKVSMFYDDHWSTNVDLHLFTDASDWGAGCYFDGAWLMQGFQGPLSKCRRMSINWSELYAITLAAATWGMRLRQKKVLFHCDNMSMVQVLQSGTSKNRDIMKLVRLLFYICAHYNFECNATHVGTKENGIADSLSRNDLIRFRTLAPNADVAMSTPVHLGYESF
jgi:hypothetical protein